MLAHGHLTGGGLGFTRRYIQIDKNLGIFQGCKAGQGHIVDFPSAHVSTYRFIGNTVLSMDPDSQKTVLNGRKFEVPRTLVLGKTYDRGSTWASPLKCCYFRAVPWLPVYKANMK